MEFGLMPDFTKIGRYHNPDYAHRKYLKNPLAGEGNVDGIFTGNTVRSLFVKKDKTGFIFEGKYQWQNLLKKYGDKLSGLNQKTFSEIQRTEQAPLLAKYINEEIGIQ